MVVLFKVHCGLVISALLGAEVVIWECEVGHPLMEIPFFSVCTLAMRMINSFHVLLLESLPLLRYLVF
jgi:hypothetical protein